MKGAAPFLTPAETRRISLARRAAGPRRLLEARYGPPVRQLGLLLDPAPVARRAAALEWFHPRLESPAEALAGEKRAGRQDRRVREVFERPWANGKRLTPTQVQAALKDECGPPAPLLTSIRRSLTNLTRAGLLIHHREDRRPGPRGARESTWSLA